MKSIPLLIRQTAIRSGRHHFPPSGCRQIGKDRRNYLTSDIRERVAVEEEKRGAVVALLQELYGFVEGEDLLLSRGPFACARCLSLAIRAVLRASSCARSSIEADDKLPTPVFEKLGSGL
jgi:hypothetical protein